MSLEGKTIPLLLLKFRGRVSAVALRDVPARNEKTIKEGWWYSPTKTTKERLLVAFKAGEGRIILEEGKWVEIRQVQSRNNISKDAIVEEAKKYARTAPDVFPNGIITLNSSEELIDRAMYPERLRESIGTGD